MITTLITAALAIYGMATVYAEPYVGQPLYCSRSGAQWVYSEQNSFAWVALPVDWYESGKARCGDLVRISIPGGEVLHVLALDAGPLSSYYIADHPQLDIIADLPQYLSPFPGLSSPIYLINLSALRRKMEARYALLP